MVSKTGHGIVHVRQWENLVQPMLVSAMQHYIAYL
jgi:hypothetical protein